MALVEDTLFGREDKVKKAIDRLKAFEPSEGYYLAFSGGKDSQCIYHLAKMAGVKFDAHYHVTSVDPPEVVRFIREQYPDVKFDVRRWNDGKPEHYYSDGRPKPVTMWNLIESSCMPPTRPHRYCCEALKEHGGAGRVTVTGVRWAESAKRSANHGAVDIRTQSKKLHAEVADNQAYKTSPQGSIIFMDDNADARRMVEQCYAKRKTTINPIVEWSEDDVWEFLNDVAKVPHCCLYDEGIKRIGCIGCPVAGYDSMISEFNRWPAYRKLYIMALGRVLAKHGEHVMEHAHASKEITAEEYFDYWLWHCKRSSDRGPHPFEDDNGMKDGTAFMLDL